MRCSGDGEGVGESRSTRSRLSSSRSILLILKGFSILRLLLSIDPNGLALSINMGDIIPGTTFILLWRSTGKRIGSFEARVERLEDRLTHMAERLARLEDLSRTPPSSCVRQTRGLNLAKSSLGWYVRGDGKTGVFNLLENSNIS